VAGSAILLDAVTQPLERVGIDSDILEADMPERHVAHGLVDLEAILDGLVFARQHEDEIHDPPPLAALPYFEALCANKWRWCNQPRSQARGKFRKVKPSGTPQWHRGLR